jgi:signal transduction histidine kinase
LNGPDNGSLVLPAAISTALFHISQEALANIAKHAVAHQAKISLWQADRRVLLEITDDGVGFDTSKVSLVLGHGLANMRTRARKMGGDIEVVSEPGKGTSVLTWIPLEQNGHADQPQQSKD